VMVEVVEVIVGVIVEVEGAGWWEKQKREK